MTRRNRPTRPEPTRHDRTDTSDGSVTGPNLQNPTLAGQVAVSILKNSIYLTRPTKPLKEGQNPTTFGLLSSDPTMFGLPLLKSAQILTQICLNPMNLAQIYSNSAKLR